MDSQINMSFLFQLSSWLHPIEMKQYVSSGYQESMQVAVVTILSSPGAEISCSGCGDESELLALVLQNERRHGGPFCRGGAHSHACH